MAMAIVLPRDSRFPALFRSLEQFGDAPCPRHSTFNFGAIVQHLPIFIDASKYIVRCSLPRVTVRTDFDLYADCFSTATRNQVSQAVRRYIAEHLIVTPKQICRDQQFPPGPDVAFGS